jgi:SNF2 family DNA or RNA helicase
MTTPSCKNDVTKSNLQAGRYLFNYDLNDSYSIYAQRNGRIKRLGSVHDTVYIYNFVVQGAIDEKKYQKIMAQKEIIDMAIEKTTEEEDAVIRATASMERELINELKKMNKKRAK